MHTKRDYFWLKYNKKLKQKINSFVEIKKYFLLKNFFVKEKYF